MSESSPTPGGPKGPPPGGYPAGRLGALAGETARFGAVAVFSFSWILATSAVWVELVGLPERLGVAIAFVTALVINFTLLRIFVWPGQSRRIGPQFAATAVTSASFRAVEYGLFLLLVGALGAHYLAATALAIAATAIAKFAVYRNVVFRRGASASSPGAGSAKPPGS